MIIKGMNSIELSEAVRTKELIKEAAEQKKELEDVLASAQHLEHPLPESLSMEQYAKGIEARGMIPEKIAEIRKPEILSLNISDRLVNKEGITPWAWEKADHTDRAKMLEKAFNIMLDEMHLPDSLRRQVVFEMKDLKEGTDGNCLDMLKLDAKKDLSLNTNLLDRARVEISNRMLGQAKLEAALRCVFHEAVITMEHGIALEGPDHFVDPKMAETFINEIRQSADGTIASMESTMQTYARSADVVFSRIYEQCTKAKGVMNRHISFK